MWGFLGYYLVATTEPARHPDVEERMATLRSHRRPRAQETSALIGNLAGAAVEDVTRLGQAWLRAELRRGDFFHRPALDALLAHQGAGHRIALVSCSLPAVLAPLARLLDVGDVWCTSPEIRNGRYTGELSAPPMLGERKAAAVELTATTNRADLADCTAYGDHVTDLPMLRMTGHAVVVGEDSTLTRVARQHGWRRLPGVPR
ncbi:hypothetical protein Cch01nite_24180 [Cellulomonas chitinilytica]|uniref:HAD-IB family hydrolase n=2 Tax=Cellulomonas chitinilytica TaxID=398759 RepID=A0A919P5E7_9CELL|nr:hypothetical protein Cch01nite_24180 [Cellulomonas chitinilytica]